MQEDKTIEELTKFAKEWKKNSKEIHKEKIREASEVIFPLFLEAVEEGKETYITDYKKIKKWAKITLEMLNSIYPPDIFTGISGDKGPKAVILIRGILKEGLKKEV